MREVISRPHAGQARDKRRSAESPPPAQRPGPGVKDESTREGPGSTAASKPPPHCFNDRG